MSISQTVAYRVCWMRVSNRKYPETYCSCICSVACVRVCASVCVCAHFLNICQSGALYPQKRESRNFFAIFVFVVCLPACLGDFHSITSLVFFSVRWAWLVYFLLFSLVFFSYVVIFGHLLPAYLLRSPQATYATACTHILAAVRVVRVLLSFDFAARRIASKLVMPNALSECLETLPVLLLFVFGFTFLLCHILWWPLTHTHAHTAKPGIVQFALAASTLARSLALLVWRSHWK